MPSYTSVYIPLLCLLQFLSIRRTLEANMQMDRLYPPGKVWWAVRVDSDAPSHPEATALGENYNAVGNVRLYEVLDVEKVFGQVVFARDMLRYASTYAARGRVN
jgi:sn1-specific diacylglycerol lipase